MTSTRVDDRAGTVLRPAVVRFDEASWLGVHSIEARAERSARVRRLLHDLTVGTVDAKIRDETSSFDNDWTASIAASYRYLYLRGPRGVARRELELIEAHWLDHEPALILRSPALELDFGHSQQILRGTTWILRRARHSSP